MFIGKKLDKLNVVFEVIRRVLSKRILIRERKEKKNRKEGETNRKKEPPGLSTWKSVDPRAESGCAY